MSCRQAELLMQESLDRALSPAERAGLDRHWAQCAQCRRAADEYRALARTTAGWARRAAAEDPGDAFTAQVMARIVQRERTHIWGRTEWTAACLLLALLTLLSLRWGPPALQVVRPAAGLLPGLPVRVDLSGWLLDGGQAVLSAGAGFWRDLTQAFPLPSWLFPLLLAALLVNGLLLRRVRQPGRLGR